MTGATEVAKDAVVLRVESVVQHHDGAVALATRLVSLVCAAMIAFGGVALAAPRLEGAVDPQQRRAVVGKPGGFRACVDPPPPEKDIAAIGFYKDRAGTQLDPDAQARNRLAVKPVEDYARSVQAMADNYLRAAPADVEIARCVLDWLYAWAQADALLGEADNRQAQYERAWMTSALAAPLLLIRDESGLDAAKLRAVSDWLKRLGEAVRQNRLADATVGEPSDAHRNWAALAVMAAGAAVNDPALFDWAVDQYRDAVGRIQEDGALATEMGRGPRARHYHLSALAPLVLMAEIGARNGRDLYNMRGGALHRLADRVIVGLDDPSFFVARSGAAQEWLGRFSGAHLAWAEPYYARFRDARLVPWLLQNRPARNIYFGGDATLAFGAPLPTPVTGEKTP